MKKINLLVTTVGGMTSPDILKAFKDVEEYSINIIGVDAFEFAVGRKFVDVFKVSPNSAINEIEFVEFIENLVNEYNIDVVFPCGNEDNLTLSKYIDRISCKVMVGQYEDLIKAYDKGVVYDELKLNIPEYCPKYFIVNNYKDFIAAVKEIGYPKQKVVIKPRMGRGGRGVYILSNEFDFENIFQSKPINEYPFEFFEKILKNQNEFDDLIVMEFLQEPYYSVYSVCEDGENLFTLNHIREWGNASQTFRGKVFYDEKIEVMASKVIKRFNLTYTNNMELATTIDGKVVLFDLNPRIGASSGIDKDIGFSFPLNALKIALGERVEVNKSQFKKPKIFIRYFDQVWL